MEQKEIIEILKNDNAEELYQKAHKTRVETIGHNVYLRALIECSNVCSRNCLYCGINRENKELKHFSLSKDEIIKTAKLAKELGFKTIVLQSGENQVYDLKTMCGIIEEIKSLNLALTLSLGEKTFEEYKQYKKSGADRYLLRIETTDEILFQKMHPDGNFKNRVECLYNLKELNYETGTGILVGLPNQTIESLAKDILFFRELDADMIGLGPFIPHNKTLLKNEKAGDLELTLKVMALVRILMPNINIPATTAMETLSKNGRKKALISGANVVMPNVTPILNRENYSIYPDKKGVNALNKEELEKLYKEIEEIGDKVSGGFGASKNFKKINK